MSDDAIFIGSPTDITTGELALLRLKTTSDAQYETENGVVAVPLERWQQAQDYERATWIEHNQGSVDDRSNDHRIGFGNYDLLPKSLGHVIEFGCGPFTQLRNILTDHAADSITLVDPLATVYQEKHQHCSYKNNLLDGKPVTVQAVTVEDFQGGQFDTVIFINVLSHCRDAFKALSVIWGALKPGGVLVFEEQIQQRAANLRYDVGHPLTVRENVVNTFLGRFERAVRTDKGYAIATKGAGEAQVVVTVTDSQGATVEHIVEPVIEPNTPIESAFDNPPVQENGDKTAVSSEPPKKRGSRKKTST